MDEKAIRDRLAGRLQHLNGVEVGEPAMQAAGDVCPSVRNDRGAG